MNQPAVMTPTQAHQAPTPIENGGLREAMELARVMTTGRVMIPEHLQGSEGDCLAVVMQANQWRVNPFVCAQKTFLIKGKLGYEAQLVAAVINTNAPIKGRIMYERIGEWDAFASGQKKDESGLGVRAYAVLNDGSTVERTVYLSTIKTRNSTNWTNDPEQQLGYQAALRLARRYFPEVILGVYTQDELEDIDDAEIVTTQQVSEPSRYPPKQEDPLHKTVGNLVLEHLGKDVKAMKTFVANVLEVEESALKGKFMEQLSDEDLQKLKAQVEGA